MGKAKDSFIMYYEWEDNLSELTDEQLGAFLRAVFAYERRGEPYSGADPEVKMAVRFVRGALDRNRERYARTCERNRKNGQKGGRPKNPQEPEEPSGFFGNPQEPKKADHDHDHEHEHEHEPDPEHEHGPEPEPDRDADSGGLAAAAAAEKKALDGFTTLLRAETSIVPNARAKETLLGWYRSYGSETVERLIREAGANDARKFGYLEAIMRRWEQDGLTDAASSRRVPSRRKKATGPEPCAAPRRATDAELEENRRQLEQLLADTEWMEETQ